MNEQQSAIKEATRNEDNAVSAVSESGEVVAVNEKTIEMFGFSEEEVIGTQLEDYLLRPGFENGRKFEKMLNRELSSATERFRCANGDVITVEYSVSVLHGQSERYLKFEMEELDRERGIQEPTKDGLDGSRFEDISEERVAEIAENIRIDGPGGEIPVNALMLDLAVSHNEVEQLKQGALSVYKCVDERLQEEEKGNPNSDVCEVLKEVKKTAFGLYLRVHRGDKELHGDREGEYKNYFNS